MKSALLLTAASLAILAAPTTTQAAPSSRLVYGRGPGTEGCPDEAALRRAVTVRVGYDPFFPWAELTVVASVKRQGTELVGHVELVGKDGLVRGARDMKDTHDDCSELVASMALAISIALDMMDHAPKREEATPAPTTAPSPPTPPPPPPSALLPSTVAEAPPRAPDEARRPSFDVGLAVLASAGAAPSLAPGGELFVRLHWPGFSVALAGRADLLASRSAIGGGSVGTALRVGSVVPCVHWGAIAGCGVVTVGILQASGSGGLAAADDAAFYAAVGPRLAVERVVSGSLSAFLYGEAPVYLTPERVRARDQDLWHSQTLSVSLGLGAVLRF